MHLTLGRVSFPSTSILIRPVVNLLVLNSHWVLVVMDPFTRRIIGFGVHAGDVDGTALCRMFNGAISNQGAPNNLRSDNDPLFRYPRWKPNFRILEIDFWR